MKEVLGQGQPSTLEDENLLQLDKHLSFPLYVTAKRMIATYRLFLDKLDLTYTQYLVMTVLWDHPEGLSVSQLGQLLHLDSGTLTPLLKKLEYKYFIEREKDYLDERLVLVRPTEEGWAIKEEATAAPAAILAGIESFSPQEQADLKRLLHKLHTCLEIFDKK